MKHTDQERLTVITATLRGEQSEAVLFWDRQDPNNIGPAYRLSDESGPLQHLGWAMLDGSECDPWGSNVIDWFDMDGSYLGPDCDGVYPILEP